MLYGAGIHALFGPKDEYDEPEPRPIVGVPFPKAVGTGNLQATYDLDPAKAAIADPQHPVSDVDPRDERIRSNQTHVTHAGINHYMDEGNRAAGRLYADQHQAGNLVPVLMHVPSSGEKGEELVILSGHHRATAALLQGRQFRAKIAEGQWKEHRP